MTVDAFEFIRRFLQHVLPSGFQKVRHFGFLSPNSHVSLEMVQWLVRLHSGLLHVLGHAVAVEVHTEPPVRCPNCGSPMRSLAFCRLPSLLLRYELVMATKSVTYIVSVRHDFAQSKSRAAARLGRRTTALALLPATNSVSNRLPLARLQPTTTVARRFPPALSPSPPLWAELHNEPLP